ncbi:unnamed protein product [Rotaria sp. Silwood1]|nr:unnamed protein product [Rotaria sp. Silwood1]
MVFSLYGLIEAAFLCVNTIAILNEQVSFKIQHNSGVGYVDEYQNTVLTNFPLRAKYGIFNNRGEHLFSAFEESKSFEVICYTNGRAFTMHILDNYCRELIRVHRELQCCSGCNCFGSRESCMQQVTVECPPGFIIGTVQQEVSAGGMNYIIKDVNNTPMLTIMGPCCICNGAYSCG